MDTLKDNKTCLHCDRVLDQKIDETDLFGGLCGECENCRSWKRVHYAEVEKRIIEESQKHAAEAALKNL